MTEIMPGRETPISTRMKNRYFEDPVHIDLDGLGVNADMQYRAQEDSIGGYCELDSGHGKTLYSYLL